MIMTFFYNAYIDIVEFQAQSFFFGFRRTVIRRT